jgi:hypothetical protein
VQVLRVLHDLAQQAGRQQQSGGKHRRAQPAPTS